MRLQGLIFDLDGTLLNSAPDLRQALNRTLKDDGRRELTLKEVENLTGDGLLPMMNRAYAMTGDPIPDSQSYEHFQKFVQHYRSQTADPSQIYPHGAETLAFYKERGVKIGLCTNKQEASTLRLMDDLNLRHYFDFIAGGDTFQVHKPHPGHVAGVMEGMGVTAGGCVMIGDSTNDVRAAQGAGIPCLVVSHGYTMDPSDLGADGLIDGFKDLPKALEKLGF